MILRRRDWVQCLERAINKRAETKFAYGLHDCLMASAYCIEAITGKDVVKDFRGYKTRRGVLHRIKKYGGIGGIAESVAQRCGWAEVPPMYAQRGDWVLVKSDSETNADETLGIVDLSGRYIMVAGDQGWRAFPLASGIRAWRIG